MHEKNIKRIVLKQLKREVPKWKSLKKKEKKAIAKRVLDEVMRAYSFDDLVNVPLPELTGTPAIIESEIMSLSEIDHFISEMKKNVLRFQTVNKRKQIQDPELRAFDALLEDHIITRILAPEGYTPSKREIYIPQLLRAEILKALKYPEISYRKFCATQLNDLRQKENRVFVGLPLHKKVSIHHVQLCQFRGNLKFAQLVNFMVYILAVFLRQGPLKDRFMLYGVDSTELAAICDPRPLVSVRIRGKNVRIYGQLDADCGKRRTKRDKSEFFVGYRMHTLTVIDPQNGHSYPLISLIAPGNHHDSLFLSQLVQLGQAIGLSLKVITADEAYLDGKDKVTFEKKQGVTIITPPSKTVDSPPYFDELTQEVYMNSWCERPMNYLGKTDEKDCHEFNCAAAPQDCIHYPTCSKCREIPVDAGYFGPIPTQVPGVEDVINLRKNMERPFNLLKHRDGLEPLRVRSQQGLIAVSTFSTAVTLLLEIIGTRTTKGKECAQPRLKVVI